MIGGFTGTAYPLQPPLIHRHSNPALAARALSLRIAVKKIAKHRCAANPQLLNALCAVIFCYFPRPV